MTLESINTRISKRWAPRRDLSRNLKCQVVFKTSESGFPERLKVNRVSGCPEFDKHCISVVRKACPFKVGMVGCDVAISFNNAKDRY